MHSNFAVEKLIKLILENIDDVVITSSQKNEFQLGEDANNLDVIEEELNVEPLLFGLFKTVIKKYYQNQLRSLKLTSYPLNGDELADIESLTNMLYGILKNHTVGGTGKFKLSDARQIQKFNFWVGKLWVDYKSTSIVILKIEDNIVELLILDGTVGIISA